MERGEVDAVFRRTEDLHGAAVAVDALRRASRIDVGLAKLEDGPRIDHHGDAPGDLHSGAVLERLVEDVEADFVSQIVLERSGLDRFGRVVRIDRLLGFLRFLGLDQVGRVVVLEVITHDPHNVTRLGHSQCVVDVSIRIAQGAVGPAASGRLVDE